MVASVLPSPPGNMLIAPTIMLKEKTNVAAGSEIEVLRTTNDKGKGAMSLTGNEFAQTIIGNLCNFFNAIGVVVPPYGSLSVLWERQAKSATPTREELLEKYESDYAKTADRMIEGFLEFGGLASRGISPGG